MYNPISNETIFKAVSQTQTLSKMFDSLLNSDKLGKSFKWGHNVAQQFLGGKTQKNSAASAAEQPPFKSADEQAAQMQFIKNLLNAEAIKQCSQLSTLAPLRTYIEDDNMNITYESIENLILERVIGAGKHNFLRTLITDLGFYSKLENGDKNNKKTALDVLQKEVCGQPFKSYGDLNTRQHGDIFNSDDGKKAFKTEILAILEELQAAWNFPTVEVQ